MTSQPCENHPTSFEGIEPTIQNDFRSRKPVSFSESTRRPSTAGSLVSEQKNTLKGLYVQSHPFLRQQRLHAKGTSHSSRRPFTSDSLMRQRLQSSSKISSGIDSIIIPKDSNSTPTYERKTAENSEKHPLRSLCSTFGLTGSEATNEEVNCQKSVQDNVVNWQNGEPFRFPDLAGTETDTKIEVGANLRQLGNIGGRRKRPNRSARQRTARYADDIFCSQNVLTDILITSVYIAISIVKHLFLFTFSV